MSDLLGHDGGTPVASSLRPGPAGTRFTVRSFAEIDSTQRYLLDEARAGAPEGLVATADYQTAGRGRMGRRWEAPRGANLLASVLLRPAVPAEELHLCTAAVALAAVSACSSVAGVEAQLKWPNDLLAGGRKLAGILAEVLPAASAVAGAPAALVVVVGLGLNVAWPPPDDAADDAADNALNDDVLYMATSLWRESATRFGPGALVDPLLDDLERRLRDLDDRPGRQRLASEYRRRCLTLGRTVRVSVSDGSFTGVATDITPEGHLVVDVGACFKTVAAGDVVHLRDGA